MINYYELIKQLLEIYISSKFFKVLKGCNRPHILCSITALMLTNNLNMLLYIFYFITLHQSYVLRAQGVRHVYRTHDAVLLQLNQVRPLQ